jgi:hypothetical protein
METRNEFEVVKQIVELITGVSLFEKNRKRKIVEARMLYGIVMREMNYSLSEIGHYLGKDHTTIIHYCRSIKGLMDTDVEVLKMYLKCKELIDSHKQSVNLSNKKGENEALLNLQKQVNLLQFENKMLNEELSAAKASDAKRLLKIFKLVEENTPVGRELIVERKLIRMFDE